MWRCIKEELLWRVLRQNEWKEGKFAWNERSDEAFSPVELPYDWAVSRPFDRNMEEE